MSIKAILFDFGGTLDTGGVHWFHKFKELYAKHNLHIEEDVLRKAYVYSEQQLEKTVIDENTSLKELIDLKITIQFMFFQIKNEIRIASEMKNEMVLSLCNDIQDTIRLNAELIEELRKEYKIAVVSNFYGNLEYVLADSWLLEHLDLLVDSKKIGIRKPDTRIWQHAIDELKMKNGEVVIVGDSHKNDIAPAMMLGTRSIWLKKSLWSTEEEAKEADIIISNFHEIKEELNKII
jgi:HAD superfamily hydrolase (TIGR01549 family)